MKEIMFCIGCGKTMRLDDKDYNSKGNYDNYWICEHCITSCIEKIRNGRPFKEYWHNENDVYVIDFVNYQVKNY